MADYCSDVEEGSDTLVNQDLLKLFPPEKKLITSLKKEAVLKSA